MSQLTGWKRKALLLFVSEKTLGAKDVVSSYSGKSYSSMKEIKLSKDDMPFVADADRPRLKDLSAHLNKVKLEFTDQPEICFYHATLIILIRRGYEVQETFAEFERLWETESEFLLKHLSLRWIASACDTFVDHSSSPLRSSILLNAVTLLNTLKVCETEKFLRGSQNTETTDQNNIDALYAKHLSLYQGLTYFRIGSDDTLKNMRARYDKFNTLDSLATTILLSVFDRLQKPNTAFGLVKSLHKDEKSKWWI